jgi:hypothetical protein
VLLPVPVLVTADRASFVHLHSGYQGGALLSAEAPETKLPFPVREADGGAQGQGAQLQRDDRGVGDPLVTTPADDKQAGALQL